MKSKEAAVQSSMGLAEATEVVPVTETKQFFKRGDWFVALATFLFSGCVFYYHMAPEVTLQDSGELVTGAFTFGVPHPPGYPIWAFLGYIWSNFLVPFGNPAWRIGTMSVATGAATVGILTLLMIRSTRVLLHALPWTQAIDEKMQQWIALSVGISTSLLFGFNRGVWLWASVSEMRVLNAFSFILIAYTFFAWMIQPKRLGYLCASLLIYGLSMTNHQTVAVMVGALVVGTLALGLDKFLEAREGMGAVKKRTFMDEASLMMSSLTTFWNLLVAVLLSLAAVFILFAWLRMPEVSAPLSSGAQALLKSWGLKEPPSVQYLTLWRGFTFIGILGAIVFAEIPMKNINGWFRKIFALGVIAVLLFVYWHFACDPLLFKVEETQGSQYAPPRHIIHYASEMRTVFGMIMTGMFLLAVFSQKGWVQPRYALLYTFLIICGCAFYLYMPIASATNPPMNWGYAATKAGFLHALTRGQYEKMSMADPCAALFGTQLWIFVRGLCRQYSPVLCVFALVTLGTATVWMFLRVLENARKYRWLLFVWVGAIPVAIMGVVGLRHVFLDEGRLLRGVHQIQLFTFNGAWDGIQLPTPVLWGLALPTLLCMIIALWLYLMRLGRAWMLFVWTAFLVTSLGLIMIINPKVDAQEQEITIKFFAPAHGFFAMLIGYGIAISLVFIRYCWKQMPREAMFALCAACLALPYISYSNNWALCSLNKFDFGYQFGYRMFCPGGGYPDMTKDAVLFGGTDPGRFVPTYMILCESIAKPQHRYQSKWMKEADPNYDGSTFDRSDVYIITQNALADNTYMSYIRDHYDHTRPQVVDGAVTGNITNRPPWQQKVFKAGWTLLDRQNAYPKKPIRIPTPDDNARAFQQLVEDWKAGRAPPNADLKIEGGRVQVSGALGVMAINAILTKWIFDWNKAEHDFYVEESYVIQWMYPYLRPAGVIMKIEKEPLPSPQQDPKLWEEIVAKDTAYWNELTDSFIAREEFRRSLDAKKSFSKMRSAIAGLYLSRGMIAQAMYAFEQAVKLCPESPEGSFRLAELHMNLRQYDKARDLIQSYVEFDKYNANAINFLNQLNDLVESETRRVELEQKLKSAESPALDDALDLLAIYARLGLQRELRGLAGSMLANTNAPPEFFFELGTLFSQVKQVDFALDALARYTARMPSDPRGWIELGWVFISQGKTKEAYDAWIQAVTLGGDAARRALRDDPRFKSFWETKDLPDAFRRLLPAAPARPVSRVGGGLLGQ